MEPSRSAPEHAAVVLMAKPPIPGRVKTRLAATLGEASATEAHRLMLICALERLKAHCPGKHVLALDGYDPDSPPVSGESVEQAALRSTVEEAQEMGWEILGQSEGDLGQRLTAAWEQAGSGPIAFFGIDSPDVPAEALERLWEFLDHADVAVGPAEDGGFWTLVARSIPEGLWEGIEWGRDRVLGRLWDNLEGLGISRDRFPVWPDVDDEQGLTDLLRRLEGEPEGALARLREQLEKLMIIQTPVQDQALAVQHAGRDEPDYSSCRVLVVDDNQQNLELLEAYLEPLGCRVDAVQDGVTAIGMLDGRDRHELPDLVLLDVMMPKMSGFEVCRKIKDDPRTRAIPVMMVTALHEVGDVERAVECGTDDFLSKPVNRVELLTRAKNLLKVRHLKKELEQAEARLGRGD
ncbi:MAG: DUF2064 domain-containing protein [Phycisphaeraceae bacterium]